MSSSPRAEALRLVQTGEYVPAPAMPDLEDGSPEALEFLEAVREPHFASLAQTIDLMFTEVEGLRSEAPPYGLIKAPQPIVQRVGWQRLALDFQHVFGTAIERIEQTPTYENTAAYTNIITNLDKARWMDLSFQLRAGVGTGVDSVLTVLRNTPNIIKHHGGDYSPSSSAEVARHPSTGILMRRLAKISINHMLASRSALVNENSYTSWSDISHILDPSHFKLQTCADGSQSLAYADFDGLEVPKGYRPHYTVPPTDQKTLTKDVPANRAKIVGCPVTLLHGRLAQLFEWSVDAVEQENLWDEEWPAAISPKPAAELSRPS